MNIVRKMPADSLALKTKKRTAIFKKIKKISIIIVYKLREFLSKDEKLHY